MSDFQRYKKRRMEKKPDFWRDYDERFENFKLGILLKQARLEAGMPLSLNSPPIDPVKGGIEK